MGSDMIECEAQFANPAACIDFSYIAKGSYRYKSQGTYSTGRTLLSYSDEKSFLQKLEARARTVVEQVSAKAKGADNA